MALRVPVLAGVVLVGSLLSLRTAGGTTWHVPGDAPTIQAGIDSARAGDDVLVAPGQYQEHDIVMRAGVWIHSEQGPDATTVDAAGDGRGFDCADLQEQTVLQGFTILNGHAVYQNGAGIRCLNSRLVIRDCVVAGCNADGLGGGICASESEVEIKACTVTGCSAGGAGGIYGYGSVMTITDCEVRHNEAGSAGGIYAMGPEVTMIRCVISHNRASWGVGGGIVCGSDALTIRWCLVTGNSEAVIGGASGLYLLGGSGSISGCTVTGNSGWNPEDPSIYIERSDIAIDGTIIAFNEGRALNCVYSEVTVRCCDVYGNADGDEICGSDLGGNFSADPLFCDAENGDYTLEGNSPCLPGNHPDGVDCGLIGALGQGCGPTATEESTWGRIKMLFRSDGEKNRP